jgi:hypothetical protein
MTESEKALHIPENLRLPLPNFSVDDNDENLELWAFRLPTNVPVSCLNGVEISGDGGEFQIGNEGYKITQGDVIESESFRVLIPHDDHQDNSSSEDSEDDERDKPKYLKPSYKSFTRHWNVVTAIPELSEAKIAPRDGPAPQDKMRHAYAPIAQRMGLKRRWMPLGSKVDKAVLAKTTTTTTTKATTSIVKKEPRIKSKGVKKEEVNATPPTKRIKVESEIPKSSMSKADKKTMKAEKKAAKKAAKKAKKEKRKSK